jgi:Ni,Fe-hydrogenase III large subunit
LVRAAAVVYAQMPRPRAILGIGAGDVSPLPGPDVSVGPQEALAEGVASLRRLFAEGAFGEEVADFDVEAVRTQTEYVCPMHPEVTSAEPGSCPICGMYLVPREGTEEAGPGENGEHTASGEAATEHTCPMHPEVVRAEPGSCPICGMNLVPREGTGGGHAPDGQAGRQHDGSNAGHGAHEEHGSPVDADHDGTDRSEDSGGDEHPDHGGAEHGVRGGHEHHGDAEHGGHEGHGGHGSHGGHGHMDHGDMGFMSMVEMTKDLPRGSDGLQMERIEAPFGPLFGGLPAGLYLTLTLAGDTVEEAEAEGLAAEDVARSAGSLADSLARLDPLSPVAYRLLALRAMEGAAGIVVDERTALARAGALERERAASHLNWLASFAHLLGYSWLERRAARLQLALLRAASAEEAARMRPEVTKLARRIERTPLLGWKLRGIGRLPGDADALGPVARARSDWKDARLEDGAYAALDFEPVTMEGDDALSRLLVRLGEAQRSLELVRRAGSVSLPTLEVSLDGAQPDGAGEATVETPRGAATLRVAPEGGELRDLKLETPSARHLRLVGTVTEGEELADALVGVASLDLSPWGVSLGVER